MNKDLLLTTAAGAVSGGFLTRLVSYLRFHASDAAAIRKELWYEIGRLRQHVESLERELTLGRNERQRLSEENNALELRCLTLEDEAKLLRAETNEQAHELSKIRSTFERMI